MRTKLLTTTLILSVLFITTGQTNACTPPPPPPDAPENLVAVAVNDIQIDLTWEGHGGFYKIERSPDPNTVDFKRIDVVYDEYFSDNKHGNGLSPCTTYWYRVRAANAGGDSGYSNVDSDTTWAGRATNPSPIVGAIEVNSVPTLTWTPGCDANLHHVYLGLDDNPDNMSYIAAVNEANSYTITEQLNPSTIYYWRIDVVGAEGNTVSDVWSFMTKCDADPNEVTEPQYPLNQETNVSVVADLNWPAAYGASSYDVYFGTSEDQPTYRGNQTVTGEQTDTTYNLGVLEANTTYYWRIDAKSECNVIPSDVWHFTTGDNDFTPGKAYGENPVNNTENVSVMTDLSWTPGAYATSHDVYLCKKDEYPPKFICNQQETTFDPGVLDPCTIYYWRIDEWNGNEKTEGTRWGFRTRGNYPDTYVSKSGSDENGDGSPSNPYGTIQYGINHTSSGNKVIVMPSTYTYEEDIDFDGNSITVTSLDPNDPYVVAATKIVGSNNAVTFNSGEGSDSVLTGFTITGANRGIVCSSTSPVISNCVITNNQCTGDGAGIYTINGSPKITNCIFSENQASSSGGGIYDESSSLIIENCVFYSNEAVNGVSIMNKNSTPEIVNCTFNENYPYGDSTIYNNQSDSIITNCILRSETIGEIYNQSSSPIVTYCNLADVNYSGEGNIHTAPYFVDANDPNGSDDIRGTDDDGLKLKWNSPCIDAADGDTAPDTDVRGKGRIDIADVTDIGAGNPDYVDIGAYEYGEAPGYITSFEQYQGYDSDYSFDGNDGWTYEGTNIHLNEATYIDPNDEEFHYQYVRVENCSIAYDTGGPCKKDYIHINCIPGQKGAYIDIMDGSSVVASIRFDKYGDNIYVLDSGGYKLAPTGLDYGEIESKCWDFVGGASSHHDYSYENSWMDFLIHFDWEEHTYDVVWTHHAAQDGETIYEDAHFDDSCEYYTNVRLKAAAGDKFKINRMSIMDIDYEGGDLGPGPGEDIWMTAPSVPEDANILNPLKGQCPILGTSWYNVLGEYVVKCCPIDLDPNEPNSWMQVCSGKTVDTNLTYLGYWNTEAYYNGDYFLKVEVYDDLGRLKDEEIVTTQRSYNGEPNTTCNVTYPIIGRAKPQTFSYQDYSPDLTINWPGTFPFEFRRIYNNSLRSRIAPLFFGWTHNHNIRLIEDTSVDWIEDEDCPVGDADNLGIGRLWLCLPSGGGLFIGRVDPCDSQRVIYEPSDNQNSYIIRTSEPNLTEPNAVFDVNYVYYNASDGTKMVFDANLTCERDIPQNEGLVGWTVSTGIDRQEDRFGNALLYQWEQPWNGHEIALAEISNNRTPAKLVFTNNLLPGQDAIPLCSKISICNDIDDPYGAFVNFVRPYSTKDHDLVYEISRGTVDSPITYGDGESTLDKFCYEKNKQQYMLEEIHLNSWYGSGDVHEAGASIIRLKYDDDGTLLRKDQFEAPHVYKMRELYDYDYDYLGNLITTVDVNIATIYGGSLLLRQEKLVTTPEGALLSKDVNTFPVLLPDGNEFDPCDYHFHSDWLYTSSGPYGDISKIKFHPGGGGAVDVDYYYDDYNFPLKPTMVIEYFDDDGDGDYDRPSKKTTITYDTRGNAVEQKVYVDVNDVNYVYTEYDYHQDYDFPIRQTTWQEYCQYDANNGARVEKKWLYGDANGTLINDGNSGKYLVRESTLLNDDSGEEWADTYYVYDTNSQLRQKIDPEGSITFYVYDGNGFPSRQWQGASLDGSDFPIGNPQKRFYYNELGIKILEADYLGKVEMNVCDALGHVKEARIYIDETAVYPGDFEPDSYGDNWENRTLYDYYYAREKPYSVIFPTGASIYSTYMPGLNGLYSKYHGLCDDEYYGGSTNDKMGGSIRKTSIPDGDGRALEERRSYGASQGPIQIDNLYDSMGRNTHKYTHIGLDTECAEDCDCEPNDPNCNPVYVGAEYIMHEEFEYDASGNKIGEKVYKVKLRKVSKWGGTVVLSVVPEKSNSYEYDILGRMTKQIIDSNAGGLNQTTQFGYDAAGNRIYVIDPNGNYIFTDYDNANRKVREYFAAPPGTTPVVKKEFHYYKNGKIKDVKSYDYDDDLLARSEFTYDSRGRIKRVTETNISQNATTYYSYDDVGFTREDPNDTCEYQIKITDAEGKLTWMAMYPLGKPEKIVYPSGDYEQYCYYSEPLSDANSKFNGLLEKKAVWDGTYPDPDYIKYEYDNYGKIKKITYPDEGYLEYSYKHPESDSELRLFGKYGLPTKITDYRNANDNPGGADSTYTFEYWYPSGKIKSYTDYSDYTVNYDYSFAYGQPTDINVCASGSLIYDVNYVYDLAGRLTDVCEPSNLIASFGYDDNGNRSQLKYYLDGSAGGDTVSIDYTYNACECKCDNHLVAFSTSGVSGLDFSFDASDPCDIDGLGRLRSCSETLTKVGGGQISHTHTYNYDMLSRLTYAKITYVTPKPYIEYTNTYDDAGNLTDYIYNEGSGDVSNTYSFDGDLVTGDSTGKSVNWDDNGRQTSQLNAVPANYSLIYNWEGRLRKGLFGSSNDYIEAEYTPDGARVTKKKTLDGDVEYNHKYIVDPTGQVPKILLVLDAEDDNTIVKTYIHADKQVIAQHDGDHTADKYFYLHDRLGSVRMVIDDNGTVKNHYTYDPWGLPVGDETQETVSNLYLFAGYVWDANISQYHCYRRQYDPVLGRFTSRDPVEGEYKEPMTLHKYLYCLNNPINKTDPRGERGIGDQLYGVVGAISAYQTGLYFGMAVANAFGDQWATLDVAIMANAKREAMFAGGIPKITQRGATGTSPRIDGGNIIDEIWSEAERRRGHGPFEDSAQHCWAACYFGIKFNTGTLSAIAQDIPEIRRHSGDWKRDVSAQHYGGVVGDTLHSSITSLFADEICDLACMTWL